MGVHVNTLVGLMAQTGGMVSTTAAASAGAKATEGRYSVVNRWLTKYNGQQHGTGHLKRLRVCDCSLPFKKGDSILSGQQLISTIHHGLSLSAC